MGFFNQDAYYYQDAYYLRDSTPPSPLLDPVPYEREPTRKSQSSYQSKARQITRSPSPPDSEQYVEQYETCPAAARACCQFAESGLEQIDPYQLKLYRRQLPGSDGKDLVIGVGMATQYGEIQPIITIENDTTGSADRGIYFTGTIPHNESQSLVACLRKSAQLHPVYRHVIYLDYLRMLQNRSASFIWDWWKSGLDMDGLDQKIREGL
ncbi:hypothetical protein CTheo_8573 [Ceratobasidium theobromae]|uniref:Uncharacterized protein n=1 Tax=Ceratobasidium theobromae TaxID=1582974 RepID=A0A5N5Q8E1_9AGAM|nr:hypothetical protein CTheo_8573 [Ceratobasidium theobromae]